MPSSSIKLVKNDLPAVIEQDVRNYVQTIAALNIVLELLQTKVAAIKKDDGRSEYAVTLGHIRSALTYERKLLAELTDPKGMAMLTADAVGKMLAASPAKAIELLTDNNDPSKAKGENK